MITEEGEVERSHATTIAAILGEDWAWEGADGAARGIGITATIVEAVAAKLGCTNEQLLNDVHGAMKRGSIQMIEKYRTDPDEGLNDTTLARWAGLVVLLATDAGSAPGAIEAMRRYEHSMHEGSKRMLVSAEFEPELHEAMQEAAQAIGIDWRTAWNEAQDGASKAHDEQPAVGKAMEQAIAALGIGTQQLARAINAEPQAVWRRVRTWLDTNG